MVNSGKKLPYKGCVGSVITITYRYGAYTSPDSAVLFSNGNRLSNTNDWIHSGHSYSNNIALSKGIYDFYLKIYRGTTLDSIAPARALEILDNPKASFVITSDSIQCVNNNEFCIKSTSEAAASGQDIVSYFYDTGDGNQKNVPDFCYTYEQSGTFDIQLIVTDKFGCSSSFEKQQAITAMSSANANFGTANNHSCGNDANVVFYNNTNAFDTTKLLSWTWNWGDGSSNTYQKGDYDSLWQTVIHNYSNDGKYSPSLSIRLSNGCSDSFARPEDVVVFKPNLNVSKVNSNYECNNDTFYFKWNKPASITSFSFNFNDYVDKYSNISHEENPWHVYKGGPGVYPLSLEINSDYCGQQKQTYCCVSVKGPKAVINPNTLGANNKTIDKLYLNHLNNDPDFDPNITQINYYIRVFDTSIVYQTTSYLPEYLTFKNGDTTLNGNVLRFPLLDRSKTYYSTDTINYRLEKQVWNRGNKIPHQPMYESGLPSLGVDKYKLHDTLIFANGDMDSLQITFPNFSQKFRAKAFWGMNNTLLHVNYDDFPTAYGYQERLNPSYPLASDSLNYFWDFNDDYAAACVSTITSPNSHCRYSTEKTPTHTFSQNDCYEVILEASDNFTGCSNITTQIISFNKPYAGYDHDLYTSIDYYTQNNALADGKPLEGMGIRLEGTPCMLNANNQNYLYINYSGLKQTCTSDNVELLFDAESDCKKKVYIKNGLGQIVDSTYRNCNWTKSEIIDAILSGQWAYGAPGWKTIGVVVKNTYSTDTFFYKNYIYIPNSALSFNFENYHPLDSIDQITSYTLSLKDTASRTLDSINDVTIRIVKSANTAGRYVYDTSIKVDTFGLLPNNLTDLTDSFHYNFNPGKYFVTVRNSTISSCTNSANREIINGHLATARAKVACAGSKTTFFDSVYYWLPTIYCELLNEFYNTTCIDTSAFFYQPNVVRLRHKNNHPNYQLPPLNEQIAWDFENDGVIDLYDVHNPQHVYPEGGLKTCAMWTMDSLGVWQKSIIEVKIPDINVSLSLVNHSKYVCPPEYVELAYKVETTYDDLSDLKFNNKYLPRDDSGSVVLFIRNNNLTKTKIESISKTGCISTVDSNLIEFMGPKAYFTKTSNDTICLGDAINCINQSDTGLYEWRVWQLSSNTLTTDNSNNLQFTVTQKGLYNQSLKVSQRLIDPETGLSRTCTNEYNDTLMSKLQTYGALHPKVTAEISQRFDNDSIEFRLHSSQNAFYTFKYQVDNGAWQTLIVRDSMFAIKFNGHGDHRLCLSEYNRACTDTFCTNLWTDDLAVANHNDSHFEIYPNPANNWLTVVTSAKTVRYEIIGLPGNTLQKGLVNSQNNSIEIETLAKGTYLIKLMTPEGSSVLRFVKN